MTDDDFRTILRAELAPIRAQLAPIRAQLDGLPLISRALVVLQQDSRALRAALKDFDSEIDELHADVNRVQAENAELATRLATLERLLADANGASDEQ
jgi:chromosome segregation ATPase